MSPKQLFNLLKRYVDDEIDSEELMMLFWKYWASERFMHTDEYYEIFRIVFWAAEFFHPTITPETETDIDICEATFRKEINRAYPLLQAFIEEGRAYKTDQIRAIAFDAYGMLCYIGEKTNPFSELLKMSNLHTSELKRLCMTTPNLNDALTQIASLTPSALAKIEEKVKREVASVRLFPEVEEILNHFRNKGYKLGVISNLAQPYAEPVQKLLGETIDHYIWSFEVGTVKPDPLIFTHLCKTLDTPPNQVLMVGDNLRADVEGARAFGMSARYLIRDTSRNDPRSIHLLSHLIG